jgi:hypothetical protein
VMMIQICDEHQHMLLLIPCNSGHLELHQIQRRCDAG